MKTNVLALASALLFVFFSSVLYSNTAAGDRLAKSNPDAVSTIPKWMDEFAEFVGVSGDKIKMKTSGTL